MSERPSAAQCRSGEFREIPVAGRTRILQRQNTAASPRQLPPESTLRSPARQSPDVRTKRLARALAAGSRCRTDRLRAFRSCDGSGLDARPRSPRCGMHPHPSSTRSDSKSGNALGERCRRCAGCGVVWVTGPRARDAAIQNPAFSQRAVPTRRRILERLSRGEARVTELAQPFAISLPAISGTFPYSNAPGFSAVAVVVAIITLNSIPLRFSKSLNGSRNSVASGRDRSFFGCLSRTWKNQAVSSEETEIMITGPTVPESLVIHRLIRAPRERVFSRLDRSRRYFEVVWSGRLSRARGQGRPARWRQLSISGPYSRHRNGLGRCVSRNQRTV